MKRLLLISIILLSIGCVVIPSVRAMGNIHFVEESAPKKNYRGNPRDEWTRDTIDKGGYRIVVWYPQDHERDDYPGDQSSMLSVRSNSDIKYAYKIISVDITDEEKSYLGKIAYDYDVKKKGYQDPAEIIGETYYASNLRPSFSLYTSIPRNVKKIFYNFEVEVTLPDGTVERTSKSIPLKQSKYRQPWHHGLLP